MKAIENLMEKRGKFDYILLETTGLADPGKWEAIWWLLLGQPYWYPIIVFMSLSGCPAVREKSGKFQTWQKSGKSQGILLKVREKNEYWEKSGNLHLVQSK